MLEISMIKDYIPLITTVIAALLTYFLGFRKGKQEKFNIQMEKSLEEVLSPMFNELRIIKREENAFQREKLLKNFFEKYGCENTNVFKISSKYIHDWYYKTEELFNIFIKEKSQQEWDNFWVYFNKFYTMVNNEYNTIRGIIYSDYRWLIDLNQKNCFLRITMEILIIMYEGIKFSIRVEIILLVGIIIDHIQNGKLVSMYFKQAVSISLVLSLLFYGLLLVVLADYSSAKHMQRESLFNNIIKKLQNKILPKKLRKIIDIDIEKEKKKITIPIMYKE